MRRPPPGPAPERGGARRSAAERGEAIAVRVIELRTPAEADGIIAATPIYKAGVSGPFKSFFEIGLESDLMRLAAGGAPPEGRRRRCGPGLATNPR